MADDAFVGQGHACEVRGSGPGPVHGRPSEWIRPSQLFKSVAVPISDVWQGISADGHCHLDVDVSQFSFGSHKNE